MYQFHVAITDEILEQMLQKNEIKSDKSCQKKQLSLLPPSTKYKGQSDIAFVKDHKITTYSV